MKVYIFILLILIFSDYSLSTNFVEEDGVIVLTDQNFEEALNTYNPLLVDFYASYCKHCLELTPRFANAAKTLRNEEKPVYLAKVEISKNPKLKERFNIEGIPDIRFFRQGETPLEFSGEKDEKGIVDYIKRKMGPPSITVTTSQEILNLSNSNEKVAAFFGNEETLYNIFVNEAKTHEDKLFVDCNTDDCLMHFNVQNGNVILFNKYVRLKKIELRETYNAEELSNFITNNSKRMVLPYDGETAMITSIGVPALFIARDTGSKNATLLENIAYDVVDEILKLGYEIIVVLIGNEDKLEKELLEEFGITKSHLPFAWIMDSRGILEKVKDSQTPEGSGQKFFTLEKEITLENILEFLKGWKENVLIDIESRDAMEKNQTNENSLNEKPQEGEKDAPGDNSQHNDEDL